MSVFLGRSNATWPLARPVPKPHTTRDLIGWGTLRLLIDGLGADDKVAMSTDNDSWVIFESNLALDTERDLFFRSSAQIVFNRRTEPVTNSKQSQ
jgi:hypothetical protein